MLDLKSIPDSEFCVVVTPPVARVPMRVTLYETGKVLLNGKLAKEFSTRPVEIRFNQSRTVIQISWLPNITKSESIVFPKSGRKIIPSAAELLKQASVHFPVVFSSYDIPENGKWRGLIQENPTRRSSVSSRNTKRK